MLQSIEILFQSSRRNGRRGYYLPGLCGTLNEIVRGRKR